MAVAEAMGRYFERLQQAWNAYGDHPQHPAEDHLRASPAVLAHDAEGDMLQWVPTPMEEALEVAVPCHESVLAYLTSWWFLVLGGRLGDRRLQLFAVHGPGALDDFVVRVERFVEAHGGDTSVTPIGIDAESGGLVVVDAAGGAVRLEDPDSGVRSSLAPDLAWLVARLEP